MKDLLMKKSFSIFFFCFITLSGFFAQTGIGMQVDGMSCGYSVSKALYSNKDMYNIRVDLEAGYKPKGMTFIQTLPATEIKKTKSDTFFVNGNCGMCESKIEKAAMSVKGVKKADWDRDTHRIIVSYNPTKADLMQIHKAIAAVGYDTDLVRADDKTYNSLHDCCKYDRSKE